MIHYPLCAMYTVYEFVHYFINNSHTYIYYYSPIDAINENQFANISWSVVACGDCRCIP